MYTLFYKHARLAFPEGRTLHRNLQELLRTQWLDREQLQALQLFRIQHLVDHAYTNVPFYRQRFREAGICPGDIRTLDDVQGIPMLTRDDVRHNMELMIAGNLPRDAMCRGSTSGSTGEPLSFYFSRTHQCWGWSAFSRIYRWHGIERGSRQATIAGIRLLDKFTLSEKVRWWLRRDKLLNCFDMGEGKMKAFTRLLSRFRRKVIVGYN